MMNRLDRVLEEFENVKSEAASLEESLSHVTDDLLEGPLGFLLRAGLASSLEKVYSGLEKCLSFIARDVDAMPTDRADGWHRAVLLQMKQPVGGRRPAVLSDELYSRLDALRSFRHRERNTYGGEIDEERVIEIAAGVPETMEIFSKAIDALSDALSGSPSP
jgi:hypothetical protein